jgi:hypothetical protein
MSGTVTTPNALTLDFSTITKTSSKASIPAAMGKTIAEVSNAGSSANQESTGVLPGVVGGAG